VTAPEGSVSFTNSFRRDPECLRDTMSCSAAMGSTPGLVGFIASVFRPGDEEKGADFSEY
jgi:hypothetical protein